jgi:hypothetical protein
MKANRMLMYKMVFELLGYMRTDEQTDISRSVKLDSMLNVIKQEYKSSVQCTFYTTGAFAEGIINDMLTTMLFKLQLQREVKTKDY